MSTSGLWEPVSPAADYVVVTPTGSLSSTNLQDALAELDSEKVSKAGDTITGALTIIGTTATDGPTLGTELLSSAGWTVGTGWVESPDDTFTHSSGVDTLTHSATIANATKYQLAYTITGRTAGTITVTFGGTSSGAVSATGAFGPTTSSTAAFTVTPTTDFNGTCVFSLKAITAVSTALTTLKDSGGTTQLETRVTKNGTDNLFFGKGIGRYCTTGSRNTALGVNSQYSLTTGNDNTALGVNSQSNLTTGISNTALGVNSQSNLTTGNNNTVLGVNSQYSLTTGSYNTALGVNSQSNLTTGISNTALGVNSQSNLTTGISNTALGVNSQYFLTTGNDNTVLGVGSQYFLTTGSYNTALGFNSGSYVGSGTTANTTGSNSIHIGYDARSAADGDTNEIVIGHGTVGLGSNTTTIGNSNTTLTRLYGNIATGVDSPSAKVHAIATTEQLRLGYDASNYASFTVSAAGVLALTTSANKIALGASRTPTSAADTGTAGEVCWDANYLYVCVATNTWKRATLSTWS